MEWTGNETAVASLKALSCHSIGGMRKTIKNQKKKKA